MSNEWEKPDTYADIGKMLAVLITAIAAVRKTMRKRKPIAKGNDKEKYVTREYFDQYAEHQNRWADETFKVLENLYGLVLTVHEVAEQRGQISDIEAKAQGEYAHRKALESDKTIRRDMIMMMRRIVHLEEMRQPKENGQRSLPPPKAATKKRPSRKKKKAE